MKITHKAVFETSLGNITAGFYGEEMPISVANFVKHIEAGFYTKLIFHRVIKGFVIQGGGFINGMFEKTAISDPIKLEISKTLKHEKYTFSMARTSEPNSATSQFFICTDRCESLDGSYAAFGTVLEGFEVVDNIEKLETKTVRHFDDVPKTSVIINKAYMLP